MVIKGPVLLLVSEVLIWGDLNSLFKDLQISYERSRGNKNNGDRWLLFYKWPESSVGNNLNWKSTDTIELDKNDSFLKNEFYVLSGVLP